MLHDKCRRLFERCGQIEPQRLYRGQIMARSRSKIAKLPFGEGTIVEVETVWGNGSLEKFAAMDEIEYQSHPG